MGTPKTLREAIQQALSTDNADAIESVRASIRDFLAQRFGAAVLDNEACENVLMDLFETINKENL
jgi:hypothetical protein